MTTPLVEFELGRHDWSSLAVISPKEEWRRSTPVSLAGLLSALSEEEAERYYWQLENRIVVSGYLFEAAPPAVPVLLAGLAGSLSEPAKGWVLELLYQLVAGQTDPKAVERGSGDLGAECRALAREGLWLLGRVGAVPVRVKRKRAR
ncbi:hypothetical protein [Actinosynnema mirum]|uniref:Uncharacterized protein n=1 Tax=Actinosynnema mirum (strain ATCC 29888 / DSM 43827 / JCM 3225 / NBRC 14064 / NCIMB 13271 / NRRL B-12336 / IMRU 3971 / 101) TaxID=446462 RepID=C6W829_ACTMD|nr:hypothetical protein [Actinosynnema mirum]ACU37050.1 hypothetical protein Amir_3138 [Actinosynnema mirum DSM 43827]